MNLLDKRFRSKTSSAAHLPPVRLGLILLRQIPHPPPDLPLEGGGIQRFPSPSGGGTGWGWGQMAYVSE